MITKLDAAQWQFYTPAGEGEARSLLISLKGVTGVDLEIRSTSVVTVSAVTATGELLPVGVGQFVRFNGKLSGFVALEIEASSTFAFRSLEKVKWLEVPDPTKLKIDSDQRQLTPTQLMVREELQKYVARLAADQALASDVDVEELYDDIQSGDLEFEAEPDMFGLGAAEQAELFAEDQGSEEPEEESAPADKEVVTGDKQSAT